MDQAEFDKLMASRPKAPNADPQAQPPKDFYSDPAIVDAAQQAVQGRVASDASLTGNVSGSEKLAPAGTPAPLEAMMTGGAKAVFETKDFFFGDTLPEEQSRLRRTIEQRDQALSEDNMLNGFASGIGQFAVAMLGVSKATGVAKMLPWVGRVAGAAPVATEALNAAAAGAIAFDPHEERLSNLINETPLRNPITEWLAADPGDSAAEGRLKAAFESIGMDAALFGTFVLAGGMWKALRRGDTRTASRLGTELEKKAQDAHAAEVAAQDANNPGTPQGGQPEAVQSGGGDNGGTAPQPDTVGGGGGAETVQPQIVSTPTQAADRVGESLGSPTKPLVQPSIEDTTKVLDGMEADAAAIEKYGGWYQAIEAGHVFGRGEGIPYVKLNGDRELDDFMARTVDATEERLDQMKGGAVLSDKKVSQLAGQWTSLYNEDPSGFLRAIQKGGIEARKQVALMEAGFLVSRRMFQDTQALATRISMGDLSEFGGNKAAAMEALRQRLGLASSVYGSTRSIVANAGRGLRRMRSEFKVDPAVAGNLRAVNDDMLLELVKSTEGDAKSLARLANPTVLGRITDFAQFLFVNNLVSGPKTQLINFMSNAYMTGVRPMERILGGAVLSATGETAARGVLRESVKQYTYMGTAAMEGFKFAKQAFLYNDSVLAPHKQEYTMANRAVAAAEGAQQEGGVAAANGFKPIRTYTDILHNALAVGSGAIGAPTRLLGTVDEMVKQTVYRSKVMASAYVQGTEKAQQAGLTGDAAKKFLQGYVNDAVSQAFDDAGRATDPVALREALIATFQQDLLPKTLGRSINNVAANHPAVRFILPFVKTPTNVIRYGWKMTPGLNLLQTEYRDMLSGRLGPEAQAQAVGQSMLGTLYMTAAAYLVSQGTITGGGPTDPKKAAELKATGWQPYSVVVENADGTKTFIPYGRTDPVAMPFGMIADIQDAIHNGELAEDDPTVAQTVTALGLAVAKQFTSKTYLTGVSDFMDAVNEPEGNRLAAYMRRFTSNFIPYSSALRQMNTDPYLREARTMTDQLMATVPGLSDKVPAKYDAWGDPVYTRKGLWSTASDQLVDEEMQRSIITTGNVLANKPSPNHNGVDMRDVTLSDGRNAYEAYQQMAAQPTPEMPRLKDQIAKIMETEAYRNAPDGNVDVESTKAWILQPVISSRRKAAMNLLLADPSVRAIMDRRQLRVIEEYQRRDLSAGKDADPSALIPLGKAFGQDFQSLMGPSTPQSNQ